MHLFKAKFHLLTRSIKSAKKEIKSALQIDHTDPRSIFLKSYLEYLKENYKKCTKLLYNIHKTSEEMDFAQVLYFNNMGCIQFQQGKHFSAIYYFIRSMEVCNRIDSRGTLSRIFCLFIF